MRVYQQGFRVALASVALGFGLVPKGGEQRVSIEVGKIQIQEWSER